MSRQRRNFRQAATLSQASRACPMPTTRNPWSRGDARLPRKRLATSSRARAPRALSSSNPARTRERQAPRVIVKRGIDPRRHRDRARRCEFSRRRNAEPGRHIWRYPVRECHCAPGSRCSPRASGRSGGGGFSAPAGQAESTAPRDCNTHVVGCMMCTTMSPPSTSTHSPDCSPSTPMMVAPARLRSASRYAACHSALTRRFDSAGDDQVS